MKQLIRRYRKVLSGLLALVIMIGLTVGNKSTLVSAAGKLGVPTLSVVSRTSSSINLKFSKVDGATGYEVYRSATKNGTYTKIKTMKGLTYKDTKTSSQNVYYYKVRAYKSTTGKNVYGSYSAIKGVKANLTKPTSITAKALNESIKITWAEVAGADKYMIYRSTSKEGTYEYLASAKGTGYTDKNVVAGKAYYYKIRVYALKENIKYYSSYTKIVTAKATKYTFQQEVVDLINKERKAIGLSTIQSSKELEGAAYERAKETHKLFSHTRPNGESCFTILAERGVSYRAAGENIAYGQTTPKAVMEAWMNSEGHRKNILSGNFGKVGIGYYVVNGTPYWVQLFTD